MPLLLHGTKGTQDSLTPPQRLPNITHVLLRLFSVVTQLVKWPSKTGIPSSRNKLYNWALFKEMSGLLAPPFRASCSKITT